MARSGCVVDLATFSYAGSLGFQPGENDPQSVITRLPVSHAGHTSPLKSSRLICQI
jgi:hypothetical protein